jgi:tetratricopeptide (TPR) repeat protein
MSDLFAQAINLEETNPDAALRLYERVLDEDDKHVAAYVNAGTIHYNKGQFTKAEECYLNAIHLDPKYALAYFDLANVYDETGHRGIAIKMYEKALKYAPDYADAHYNLAIVYGNAGDRRKSLMHFQAYLKLDKSSAWADHARSVITQITAGESLKVVRTNPRPKLTKRRAKLMLVKK